MLDNLALQFNFESSFDIFDLTSITELFDPKKKVFDQQLLVSLAYIADQQASLVSACLVPRTDLIPHYNAADYDLSQLQEGSEGHLRQSLRNLIITQLTKESNITLDGLFFLKSLLPHANHVTAEEINNTLKHSLQQAAATCDQDMIDGLLTEFNEIIGGEHILSILTSCITTQNYLAVLHTIIQLITAAKMPCDSQLIATLVNKVNALDIPDVSDQQLRNEKLACLDRMLKHKEWPTAVHTLTSKKQPSVPVSVSASSTASSSNAQAPQTVAPQAGSLFSPPPSGTTDTPAAASVPAIQPAHATSRTPPRSTSLFQPPTPTRITSFPAVPPSPESPATSSSSTTGTYGLGKWRTKPASAEAAAGFELLARLAAAPQPPSNQPAPTPPATSKEDPPTQSTAGPSSGCRIC